MLIVRSPDPRGVLSRGALKVGQGRRPRAGTTHPRTREALGTPPLGTRTERREPCWKGSEPPGHRARRTREARPRGQKSPRWSAGRRARFGLTSARRVLNARQFERLPVLRPPRVLKRGK